MGQNLLFLGKETKVICILGFRKSSIAQTPFFWWFGLSKYLLENKIV